MTLGSATDEGSSTVADVATMKIDYANCARISNVDRFEMDLIRKTTMLVRYRRFNDHSASDHADGEWAGEDLRR